MTHADAGLPRELNVSTYTAGRPTVTGEHAGECPESRLTVVHDYFRDQFRRLRHQLATMALDPGSIQSGRRRLNRLAVTYRTAMCRGYCEGLISHHRHEDARLFPALREHDPGLDAVLDRLDDEHQLIHRAIGHLDKVLVAAATPAHDAAGLTAALDALDHVLESHFHYEEHELGPAINTLE